MIQVGCLDFQVFETGGHTPGSVTFVVDSYVFPGDALFAGSVGGTSTEEDRRQQREALMEKIITLGDELTVCPGHGPMSRVGVEKCYNPFLGLS